MTTTVPQRIETGLTCQNTTIPAVGGINFAGFIVDSTGVPDVPMRIWGKYAAVYLLEGSGRFQDANGLNLVVRPGDLIVVFPDVPHTYGPQAGEKWDEFYVVFDGPVFHAWREQGLISPGRPVLHLEPVAYWLRRLVAAAGESTGGDLMAGLAGACRMQQLLADIVTAPTEAAGADRDWLARAKALLDGDPGTSRGKADGDVNLRAIAGQLGVGYETFRKRFAKLAGMSPARYRAGRVMDRAARLLADPRVTLRDVAGRCGFCDEFHFSKRFKQLVGMSPAAFRKRLRQG